ncbi:MAG: ferredoxin family protein [Proteobacteria bacterium]|nr:ferredoxin family protein [Pseudomonadota bacterium]MBU1736545.1 ferredoxin family protein [Pseudomonadota bacterium]
MQGFRYIEGVVTLQLTDKLCVGCGMCEIVCPHTVFAVSGGKAALLDPDGCMECGACANNCPTGALAVNPGVGCASYIIQKWWMKITGKTGEIKCC